MDKESLEFGFWACGILASLAFAIAFANIFSVGVGFLIGGICLFCLIPISIQLQRFFKIKNDCGNEQ